MGVNSLPKTVTRQRRGCDLNPGPSAPEPSTLTTRLPSHPSRLLTKNEDDGLSELEVVDAEVRAVESLRLGSPNYQRAAAIVAVRGRRKPTVGSSAAFSGDG